MMPPISALDVRERVSERERVRGRVWECERERGREGERAEREIHPSIHPCIHPSSAYLTRYTLA
jgi:hypothetical protein